MSSRSQYPDVQAYFKYIYKDVLSTDFLLVSRVSDGYTIMQKRFNQKGDVSIIREVHIGDNKYIHEAINGKWVIKK